MVVGLPMATISMRNEYMKCEALTLIIIGFINLPWIAYAESAPNIVLIVADDLGYGDLGCYGQQLIKTPNIDQLAAEGVLFKQAYAGGPVCTSSRSVLMTGLHNGHGPARDNIPHYHTYLSDEDVTIAEVLKKAGYRTGGVGKWSLGDAGTIGRATNQGFDTWFGYLNQDHAHYYYTEYLDDDEARIEFPNNSISREHYSHDLLTERALRFIRESSEQPFFLYAAFTVPHFAAADEDPDRFSVPTTRPYSERDWDERSKKYASMVHMLDRDVGRIVDLLDALDLTEKTVVVFTSDNGGHSINGNRFRSSGPLRGYKRDLTEGGIRVPFIAHWPGTIPSGKISSEVIAFQDLLPTFAELAGVTSPALIDGISVVDALQGNRLTQSRPYLYWDYGHNRTRYDQAVRMGDWKGLRFGKGNTLELYNLATDLGETKDVSSGHPSVVSRMERIMEEAVTQNERYKVGKRYSGKPIWKSR